MTLESENELLQIVHFFETDAASTEFALPDGNWELEDCVKADALEYTFNGKSIIFEKVVPFSAAAFRYRRK
ncbi:MAG: hypothetical protein IKB25_04465 [Lentisphaeria bacterium]|nr:hypothetical protein [Lentisphaeria bacterium]